jgi:hypothetical protein
VFVSNLADNATVVVQTRAGDQLAAEQRERELRLQVHDVLRADGVFA